MADGKMSDVLSPTAKALSRAAVIAHNDGDEGCVKAILSALWNLASHSDRNKRAICDEPGFLAVLTTLLTNDARMTAVVESTSGILKYVSQYLLSNSTHISARPELAMHLVQLLSSASFTIVANTLGALSNLIAKDPHLQSLVRHDAFAMNQLNVLRNSAREDIRVAVKAVLNHLNQPIGYACYRDVYLDMSSSIGCEPMCSMRDSRLLTLRGVRISPGGVGSSAHHCVGIHPTLLSPGPPLGFAPPPEPDRAHHFDDTTPVQPSLVPDEITGDPDLEDSIRCTRSVSAASLGSELPNTSTGWQSSLDTATNSNRMSPISPSELPDSPTQCSKITKESGDPSTPLSVTVRTNVDVASTSEQRSGLTASDTTTAIIDDQPTPTFPAFILHSQPLSSSFLAAEEVRSEIRNAPSLDDIYAVAGSVDGAELLARSIEAVLPQPSPRTTTPRQQRRLADGRLLAHMMESVQPSPRKPRHNLSSMHQASADRLLTACINAAMPQTPSSRDDPKNEKDGRGCTPVSRCVRPSHPNANHNVKMVNVESKENAHKDDENCFSRKSSESWSDNDNENVEQPDTTLPLDCFVEDDITIDCSAISLSSRPHSSSATAGCPTPNQVVRRSKFTNTTHRTRLPKPATNSQSSLQTFSSTIIGLARNQYQEEKPHQLLYLLVFIQNRKSGRNINVRYDSASSYNEQGRKVVREGQK
ncbi:unnamed protein product [Angiostrongylus costaricensis]|uniref:Arm_2 domain-containing protein n=1 Tax=Angiostrongylus costaricensis TaxID=334426 RepID=A0A0R3Q132_ANGCS|nr:unnamed protein product [Angiostrongylus costaricensis]